MKVGLLKKLHKKYDWYFSTVDKCPVLIDKEKKTVQKYNKLFCASLLNKSVEDLMKDIEVDEETYLFRIFKYHIIPGWTLQRSRYTKAVNILKRKRNVKKNI